MEELRLIIGLGNPGRRYTFTRHNIGFLVLHHIVKKYGVRFRTCLFPKGISAEGSIENHTYGLFLPQTFMNNSGRAVKKFVERKSIPYKNILVVCDDFNLDFGQLRIRARGSDGGHNGLHSIVFHLGIEDFSRLRVGIGCAPNGQAASDYVLEEFSNTEKKELGTIIQNAAECCVTWLLNDTYVAMNQFNKKQYSSM